MSDAASLEGRVGRLERVYTALKDQRTDGVLLADSVDRLGTNANALQEALLQVDRNQQALSQLGTQLADVEREAATKTDLAATKAEQDAQAREFTSATLRRTYLIGLLLLAGLAIAGLVVSEVLRHRTETQISVCNQRNQQTEMIVQVLARNGLAQDAERFSDLVINCEKEFGR
jgi:hypothetical protein